jgi:antibiotic biosynthesis monooxygenase (ABM) superfamily enzyme
VGGETTMWEKKGEKGKVTWFTQFWVGFEPMSSGTWNMVITTLAAMPQAANVFSLTLTPFPEEWPPLGRLLLGLEHVLSWLHPSWLQRGRFPLGIIHLR